MTLHVLPGDSLVRPFRKAGIPGDVAVFRECLCDGPLQAASIEEFFLIREEYLSGAYPEKEGFYTESVRPEIERVLNAREDAEICLWFEHELFCQVNLWFCIDQIAPEQKVFLVAPEILPGKERFAGWAALESDRLKECYERRKRMSPEDRALGRELWSAFTAGDGDRLSKLSLRESAAFTFLPEVAAAAAAIDIVPVTAIREIVENGAEDFGAVFREFSSRYAVYGFGDLQVQKMWKRV